LKTPTFITGRISLQHFTIVVSKLNEIATTFNPMLSLSSTINELGTNLEEIFLFCKFLSKIFLVASLPTPRPSASGLMFICLWCEFSSHFLWTERKLTG
jgi:hypothetical protein